MSNQKEWTSIPLRVPIRDRLERLKEDGESYGHLIERALDYVKEHEMAKFEKNKTASESEPEETQ
jgi:hypothetical protein